MSSAHHPPEGRVPGFPGRRSWPAALVAGVVLAAAAIVLVRFWRSEARDERDRVYRIGYGRDVPFHFRGPDGQPTGLAVELVKEAARRLGIGLEWVEGESMEADRLDLWVLMTLRPEPRKDLHLSEPFLQTHNCFLVPASSPLRNLTDFQRARVGFLDFAIHRRNLDRLVPGMQPVPVQSPEAALGAVVEGRADAAYLDEFTALAALLRGASGGMPMRFVPAPLPKSEMGLASTPASAGVADAIREEMHAMERDGSLLRIAERWGFFPNLTTDQIAGVADIRRRVRWLTVGVAGMTVLAGIAVGLAVRSRRQTIRLERIQARLRESEQQLRQAQKMEAIGQLAGGVAHDFNNLLAASLLELELLRSTPGLDRVVRTGLEAIEANARRATNLTRQLLMFSRRSVMETKTLDLNEVVEGVLGMLGRLLGENVRMVFERADAPLWVRADAGLLEQVLVNLAVNARDAMADGGVIRIVTGTRAFEAADCQGHSARRLGRFAFVAVSDSGSGMSDATLSHLFEPFFTTKAPGKGTGLGLATVHGIVAQHRGWVEVKTALGRGSTFTIFVPEAPSDSTKSPADRTREIPRGQETILVVEDEEDVRRPLVRMLGDLGYRVLEAGSGPEALTVWRRHGAQIDLIFTDMVMPQGMSGRTLAERIREEKPHQPVIISSGFTKDWVEADDSGAQGIHYLPKPYAKAQLAKALRDALEGRNGANSV